MGDRGPPRVKNKAPNPIQITAEQLLREAFERREPELQIPKHRISDLEEVCFVPVIIKSDYQLQEFQSRKRREFEDGIRRNRLQMGNWKRYAQFEVEQNEFARARSVFERALDVTYQDIPLWLAYIDMEMKSRNIQHARNLLDRAVTLLPRVDKFWYKYVYLEETLGNIAGTRQVFERWTMWEPDEDAWSAYIKMEKRYGEYGLARTIFEKFTIVHPEPKNWIKWARFEDDYGTPENVREVFTLAIDTLGDEFMDEKVFIAYARFEAKQKEYERARVVYKYALDRLPRSKAASLYRHYTTFEKQFGDTDGIEDVILTKRRLAYESEIKDNPKNFDIWFDLTRLEETAGDVTRVRETYERAIAQLPPSQEKKHWRRYIYLWLNYAVYEELETNDYQRAREIYRACIKLVPHKIFTFAKVWIAFALFEIRRLDVSGARKILGQAIGMCPKERLFKGYVDLETQLREFDRCRILYQKYLMFRPENCSAWIKYAELERMLGDLDLARHIYELGLKMEELDMPELLWKAYIDFEFEEEEYDCCRTLYERLLEKTSHVKVWISFARFEISLDLEDDKERAENVFKRAEKEFKEQGLKEERVVLMEAWHKFEQECGTPADVVEIEKRMPKTISKRQRLDDGTFEEYYDYIFPMDEGDQQSKMSKLMDAAAAWKENMRKKQESRATAQSSGGIK
ncbi:Pre-mRNA-splicing factor CLF1 [Neolecta irregularis DAH-3]|uniref:Pre-mRNA-splicing factor CLF1 n=1 Tax=Neolecta irregularis (strain DAH-3) TaxID=1198029 RepID=A0A1U7LSZ1_NEOID|nr:Pre-mRNA-splicing factor CLF1 [Neolecta irregularis DAH-3]|eukprot:OLL25703.1 Pre-mRNA-splicing factor CLF1 [Neolecta irregularis DAH-3]